MKFLHLFWLLLVCPPLTAGEARSSRGDAMQMLRESAGHFARVLPGRTLVFPKDHGPHPEYRIEWWYITANLEDSKGRPFGVQWTLFRQSLTHIPKIRGFDSNQMWMAHAALSSPARHESSERFSRGGTDLADVRTEPVFTAFIDDWEWRSETRDLFPASLSFSLPGARLRLQLQVPPGRDYVLQGDRGFSVKSEAGQASYYYSQPWIRVKASLLTPEGEETKLSGFAWLDREWSSQPLSANQEGWDWFSLHLPGEQKLMLYQLRHTDGRHYLRGSLAFPDGRVQQLQAEDLQLAPVGFRRVQGRLLPLDWQIQLPSAGLSLTLKPRLDDQWMDTIFPYWEGMLEVSLEGPGREGQTGVGYMELTGYPAEAKD